MHCKSMYYYYYYYYFHGIICSVDTLTDEPHLHRVVHKKVGHFISLPMCIPNTENFYNISRVPKTLVKMPFNMSTTRCDN